METQQERNKALAMALGYRVAFEADRGYSLYAPDGSEYGYRGGGRQEMLDAYYASSDEAEAWALAPGFTGSVDALLSALTADFDIIIEQDEGRYFAWVVGDGDEWRGEGATRAEALFEATLKWAQARKP